MASEEASGATQAVRPGLNAQTRTTGLAASVFIALALVIAFVPVPFVTWAPGSTIDLLAMRDGKDSIDVENAPTYPSHGQLLLLTVAQSRANSQVTLPQALINFWLPHHDVLPREFIYPNGTTAQQQQSTDVQQMNTAQQDAVVAALRAAGRPVTPAPVVTQITNSGPSNGLLRIGDFVEAVNGKQTPTPDDVYQALHDAPIGSQATFAVMRAGHRQSVSVDVVGSNQDKTIPVVGARFETGYEHTEAVTFNLNSDIVGSSGGLMFALAIYDRLAQHDIPAGRVVAGTGKIDAFGHLDAVGGVREKLAAAEASNASIFLVPAANCGDLTGVHTKIRVVRIATLSEAVTALAVLEDPARAGEVPTC